MHHLKRKAKLLWREMRARLKFEDVRQQSAFSRVVRFFALMLVLTLVARGTAAATMPVVVTALPAHGTLTQTIQANGTVSAAGGTPFFVPEGLVVQEICVRAGEPVEAGKPVARFDTQEVENALRGAQAALAKMQVQHNQLRAGSAADNFGLTQAQAALDSAYTAYHKAVADGEAAVGTYTAQRGAAQQVLDELLSTQPENADAIATAQQTLADAQAAMETAQAAAQNSVQTALGAAQQAEDARNSALHSYETAVRDIADTNAAQQADADVLAVQIETQKKHITALQAVQTNGGALLAPCTGTLKTSALTEGVATQALAGTIADAESGFMLTFLLEEVQAKECSVGMALRITQKSSVQNATVTALATPDADGAVRVTAQLPEGKWLHGAAQVEAELSRTQYDAVLPATALHMDSEGTFVFLIEPRNTVLGLQNTLVRLPVAVLEETAMQVAVSGSLSAQTPVASTATKPLSAGARVRIDEGA